MAQTESQYAPLEQTWLRRKRDESLTVDAFYRTVTNPQGAIGAAVFGLLIFVAIFADLLAPHGEAEQIRGARLLAPSGAYWFGTDDLSRDIFSRILFGLRISLYVSVAGVLGGGLVGTIVGFVSGYAGGWLEAILMRIVDTLLAFPFLLLGIAVLAILGTGTSQVALALGIANIPYSRGLRGRNSSPKKSATMSWRLAASERLPRESLGVTSQPTPCRPCWSRRRWQWPSP